MSWGSISPIEVDLLTTKDATQCFLMTTMPVACVCCELSLLRWGCYVMGRKDELEEWGIGVKGVF